MLKIGFIGLGNMGLPMSMNLSKSDNNVIGTDINKNIIKDLTYSNVKFSEDLLDVVQDKDVVITMLPNGEIVKDVWTNFMPLVSKNTTLVDCSTIDLENTKFISDLASKFSLSCLDAPVSGGVNGAINGTLTFMVGGNEKKYNELKPLFNLMGNKSILCGDNGSGQLAKTCNNLILAISMIGVSEAFNLAKNTALSQKILYEVLSTSTASCWAINNYCPIPKIGPKSPADDNYKGGFATSLMAKDLGIAIQAIEKSKTISILGKNAEKIYNDMNESGLGHLDFSAVIDYIERL